MAKQLYLRDIAEGDSENWTWEELSPDYKKNWIEEAQYIFSNANLWIKRKDVE